MCVSISGRMTDMRWIHEDVCACASVCVSVCDCVCVCVCGVYMSLNRENVKIIAALRGNSRWGGAPLRGELRKRSSERPPARIAPREYRGSLRSLASQEDHESSGSGGQSKYT